MPPPPPDPEGSTDLLVITGPIARADDVRRLCDSLTAVIETGDADTVVCDVAALPATARAIEALARLQLTARRANRRIRLQRASPDLQQLLEFAGLADVVPLKAPLRGRHRRHAEQREQPHRVEEAVDRDDPPL